MSKMPRTGHYTEAELLRSDALRVIPILQAALERNKSDKADGLILSAIGELKRMAESAPAAGAGAGGCVPAETALPNRPPAAGGMVERVVSLSGTMTRLSMTEVQSVEFDYLLKNGGPRIAALWLQLKRSFKTAEDEAIDAAPRLFRALLKIYVCGSGDGTLILSRDMPLLDLLQNMDEEHKLSVSVARRMTADEVAAEAERTIAAAEGKEVADADRQIDKMQEAANE